MSKSVLPMFSSSSFMVSGPTFKSLIHLSLVLCMVWEADQFASFACCCPVFPTPFIEEAAFSPLYILPPLSWIKCPQKCGSISGLSVLFHWPVCLFWGQYCGSFCLFHTRRADPDASVDTPCAAVARGDSTPCLSIPGASIPPSPKDDPGLHRLEIRGAGPEQVAGARLWDQKLQRGVCQGAKLAKARCPLSPDRDPGPWGKEGWTARRRCPCPGKEEFPGLRPRTGFPSPSAHGILLQRTQNSP